MSFLEKIENFINLLLLKLGERLMRAVPQPLQGLVGRLNHLFHSFVSFTKGLPALSKASVIKLIAWIKGSALSFDYKGAFVDTYKKAISQYKEKSPKGISTAKTIFLTPFLMLGQWLEGLTALQATVLLAFTVGSFVATFGIFFSGQKLIGYRDQSRFPASVGEEIAYERPVYYKKETKHFELVNFRLPVYFPVINEIKSVDIDFIATLSNQNSRIFLEKYEFQFRDHIILEMEPLIASFPLEDEGKEILRRKLMIEINDFLKAHEIKGEVVELKITYVLAN